MIDKYLPLTNHKFCFTIIISTFITILVSSSVIESSWYSCTNPNRTCWQYTLHCFIFVRVFTTQFKVSIEDTYYFFKITTLKMSFFLYMFNSKIDFITLRLKVWAIYFWSIFNIKFYALPYSEMSHRQLLNIIWSLRINYKCYNLNKPTYYTIVWSCHFTV